MYLHSPPTEPATLPAFVYCRRWPSVRPHSRVSASAVSPHEKRQEMYVQIVAKQATEHKANVTALTRYRRVVD